MLGSSKSYFFSVTFYDKIAQYNIFPAEGWVGGGGFLSTFLVIFIGAKSGHWKLKGHKLTLEYILN